MSEIGGSLQDWEALDFPPPLWIIRNELAVGEAGFVHGDASSFKSSFMLQMCLELSGGVPLFTGVWPAPDRPIHTLYLQSEGSPYRWKERLLTSAESSKVSTSDIPFYSYHVRGLKVDSKEGKRYVRNRIEEHTPDLLVLDPLSNLFTGSDSDPLDQGRWINLLNEWRWDYNISIMLVHHNAQATKSWYKGHQRTAEPDLDSARGRTLLKGWADIAMGFFRPVPTADLVTVTMEKLRDSGSVGETFKFRYKYPSLYPEAEGDLLTRTICAYLLLEPVPQAELIKMVQKDLKKGTTTVQRHIDKAIEDGRVISTPPEKGKSPILSRGLTK